MNKKENLSQSTHSKLMATSAQTLSTIIDVLSKKYKFDSDKAIALLAKEELLPKKMLPKESKDDSPWASKKAEELASTHCIVAEGPGSGKNGKWTLADVEKAMTKPAKNKMLISPNALNLANEKGLSLVGKKGSGKDGRILLKDVEAWLDDEDDEEDLNISPRALQEAHDAGIKDEDLATLHGSGKDGRILLEDIKKYITESEKSDDEDED
jgi:pyruvate/2-oxoglutarate dehydrogenase complex dihydrolipoamide acyltransferase (E2) component